jgi:hypothetical protein
MLFFALLAMPIHIDTILSIDRLAIPLDFSRRLTDGVDLHYQPVRSPRILGAEVERDL